MTEVTSALTKSQKEAQEMSDSVTKLAEEIKQLKVSRAREETVRAKGACVGEARKKLAHAEITERIKYYGENVSECVRSVRSAEKTKEPRGNSGTEGTPMGNAAEFRAQRLPEEELPNAWLQTRSKASQASEMLPVAV